MRTGVTGPATAWRHSGTPPPGVGETSASSSISSFSDRAPVRHASGVFTPPPPPPTPLKVLLMVGAWSSGIDTR
jgi:hypothetical protein